MIIATLFGGPKDGDTLMLAAATDILVGMGLGSIGARIPLPGDEHQGPRIGRYSPEWGSRQPCLCVPDCPFVAYRYSWTEPK